VKADLSRTTFHPSKHYSSVVAQQGRVQLDADANEQSSIALHYLRRLARDLIGPCGGPADRLGFAVTPLDARLTGGAADWAIGAGRYYVDGITCELDPAAVAIDFPRASRNQVQAAEPTLDGLRFARDQLVQLFDAHARIAPVNARITNVAYAGEIATLTLTDVGALANSKAPRLRRITTFLTQPHFAVPGLESGTFQIYLDVWERLITHLEDDSIRDVALNGADTSARAKIVWQVKAVPTAAAECLLPDTLAAQLQPANRGRLRARAKSTTAPELPAGKNYTGLENQLYRVEIHSGNLAAPSPGPTFKWSRENGAVAFAIVSGGGTDTLVLETLGDGARFGLSEGDWVEIEDDASVLENRAGPLLRIKAIDQTGNTVVLSGDPAADVGGDASKHPLLRRWDYGSGDPADGGPQLSDHDHACLIPARDTWLSLENGVQIQFVDPANSVYRTGDYWLIPARVATGDVEWPTQTIPLGPDGIKEPVASPPDGADHHYAPLAIIKCDGNAITVENECRRQFAAAALPMRAPSAGTSGGAAEGT